MSACCRGIIWSICSSSVCKPQCFGMESLRLIALTVVVGSVFLEASANVCYQGRELHSNRDGTRAKWVENARDPCACTEERLGGVNIMPRGLKQLGTRAVSTNDRIRQKCSSESSTATVGMATCPQVTLQVGAHEMTSPLPIAMTAEFMLKFSVAPQGSAAHITKEIIHFFVSSSETLAKCSIEFSQNAVELKVQGLQALREDLPSTNWSGQSHDVTLGSSELTFDEDTHYPGNNVDLTDVQFVQFESDSGTGATWTLYDVPCDWE